MERGLQQALAIFEALEVDTNELKQETKRGRPRKYSKNMSVKVQRKKTYDYMKTTYIYGGVYQIIAGGEVVYIGRSRRINCRMSKHRYYFNNPEKCNVKAQRKMYEDMRSKYDSIEVKVLELTENHKEREQYYINKLKPLYNK